MHNSLTPTESLKFTEARSKLSSLLDRVFQRETRVRLYKGNTPVAAIVSIQDLERLEHYDRERHNRIDSLFELGNYFSDIPEDELDAQIARAIEIARTDERRVS